MSDDEDNPLLEWIIFILLNLAIAGMLIFFIQRSGEKVEFYETGYAKQIALLLDQAQPGTTLFMDFEKASEISGKYNVLPQITITGNRITVKLTEKGSGTSEYFFQNNKAEAAYLQNTKTLQLTIKSNTEQ